MTISVIPDAMNSSMMNEMAGVSTMGSISLGTVFVTGKNLVPYPAATINPFMPYSFCVYHAHSPERVPAP